MSAVRRVRRIVRKIDPWTVLKVSFVFNAVVALALVLGVVIFWSVLVSAEIPQKLNDFALRITLIEPGQSLIGSGEDYFRLVVFMSVVWTVLATGLATLAAVMYNLIADVVGGIEVVVLEETLNVPPTAVRPPQRWQSPSQTQPGDGVADLPTRETPVVSGLGRSEGG